MLSTYNMGLFRYLKIDAELVLPTMRATVEQQLNLIATGKASFRDVLDHTVKLYEEKFAFFASKIVSAADFWLNLEIFDFRGIGWIWGL